MKLNTVNFKNIDNMIRLSVFVIISSFLLPFEANSQDFSMPIKKAWETNEQLKSQTFDLQAAMAAYRESKSMFGPSVIFGVQYTLASGGRNIDIPVGDLLNPVYSTLNQLTASNSFPQISNVQEQLIPNNFYDSKLRISQAIFYPDLILNKKAKNESIRLKELEIKAFKRQLTADVMKAYFQCMAAKQAVFIYNTADTLLMEAKRSTQSMINNGVALPSALSRIENQQALIQAQKLEAQSNFSNAKRYYNFLQGNKDDAVNFVELEVPGLPGLSTEPFQKREELLQLDQGIKLKTILLDKEKQFYYPKLGVQLDLGSQAFDFGFKPYALFGLNFEINLYDSKRHSNKKDQINSEILAFEHKKSYAEEQFALQVAASKETLESSILQANTFQMRIKATEKIYNEVLKKYKEGVTNYLELIDAHTQLTQIYLQYNLSKYNSWIRWAEHVYASASYPVQ
ncbi:MAG: TolC family protein [Saprospiraceae bacterium]|nr:TolC family protein [Saprospiraceae bacterium]